MYEMPSPCLTLTWKPVTHPSIFSSEIIFTRKPFLTSAGWSTHRCPFSVLSILAPTCPGISCIPVSHHQSTVSLLRAGTLSYWSLYSQCLLQCLAKSQRLLDGWTMEWMLQNPGQFPRSTSVPTVLKPYWMRVPDSLGLSTVKNPSHSAGRPLKFSFNGLDPIHYLALHSKMYLKSIYFPLIYYQLDTGH